MARCITWALLCWSLLPAAAQFNSDFLHGVSSGDPFPDSVILWTRVTPRDLIAVRELPVSWEVWPENGSEAENVTGKTLAKKQRDFTVKVEASSLLAGVRYNFRFRAGSAISPVGRFRLPPGKGEALERLKYAIFSCSNWQWGTFAAYARAAVEELDFWLHLGDFIYESGIGDWPHDVGKVARPGLVPEHEIVTLGDYRTRHGLYRTDPDLQTLAASAPVIPIWDDHEITNDVWMHGAENHQPATEGDFEARKAAAMQAYHEWMPTRFDPEANGGLMKWRAFNFGDLSTLMVLETRLNARTSPNGLTGSEVRRKILDWIKNSGGGGNSSNSSSLPPPLGPERWANSDLERKLKALKEEAEAARRSPEKHLLGSEQLEWIRGQVSTSLQDGVRWRLVAQQLAQPLRPADFERAIGHAKEHSHEGVRQLGVHWASAWENATVAGMDGEPTYVLESAAPWAKPYRGQRYNITGKDRAHALMDLASARYDIPLSYDGWTGFVADRDRFLSALTQGGDPTSMVVYGGDSHNAWAGSLRNSSGHLIATEFDGMSVSSAGIDDYQQWLPSDLVSAAWVSSNEDLAWAETEHRGFMLVTLTHDSHNLTYHSVDPSLPGTAGGSACLALFATARGRQETLRRRGCRAASFRAAKSGGSEASAGGGQGGGGRGGGEEGEDGEGEKGAKTAKGPEKEEESASPIVIGLLMLIVGCVLGCLARHFAPSLFASSEYKHFSSEPGSLSDARTLGARA